MKLTESQRRAVEHDGRNLQLIACTALRGYRDTGHDVTALSILREGRIDLVRRIDTGETAIVDLESSDRAQAEEVTEAQLHVYALGYQDLTGRRPDYVEIYELDERKRKPRSVDDDFIADVKAKVRDAAQALRSGALPAVPAPKKCGTCDYRGMCAAGRTAAP